MLTVFAWLSRNLLVKRPVVKVSLRLLVANKVVQSRSEKMSQCLYVQSSTTLYEEKVFELNLKFKSVAVQCVCSVAYTQNNNIMESSSAV